MFKEEELKLGDFVKFISPIYVFWPIGKFGKENVRSSVLNKLEYGDLGFVLEKDLDSTKKEGILCYKVIFFGVGTVSLFKGEYFIYKRKDLDIAEKG